MSTLVTVTGATGNIGRALVETLLSHGVSVRAVARDASKLEGLVAKGAVAAAADLSDVAALTAALKGADAAFLMVPPKYDAPDGIAYQTASGNAIAEAVEASGLKRAVALSSLGGHLASGTGPVAGLHRFEERLKAIAGLSLVIARPTYFMENHLGSMGLIKAAGFNGGTIPGDVPFPMIATKDIAHALAGVLQTPTWDGVIVRELLGPRDYTMAEATTILGAAIGRPGLEYRVLPNEALAQALLGHGFSQSIVDGFVELNAFIGGRGMTGLGVRSPETTTPTSLEEFAKAVFAPVYAAS
ncbi:MAG: NAD(P)H-binding protein [Acidobacteria bacterium]|nr:NAD(P)H-binding protein [Acidobacteriota bacterium]